MASQTALPLAGITVVSIEQAVAAPFATRQLADLGARVIKVERPDGGDFARRYDETVHGESSYFVWLNRSKESLTLDLKSDEGRDILEKLLVHSGCLRAEPGSWRRSPTGLDAQSLQQRHPALIPCDVSGYGNTGPWSDRKAYDMLVQCESGLMSLTGTDECPPKVGVSIADIAAGMYAYSGILSALYTRATTGTRPRGRGLAVRGARRMDGISPPTTPSTVARSRRRVGTATRDDRPVRPVPHRRRHGPAVDPERPRMVRVLLGGARRRVDLHRPAFLPQLRAGDAP